MRAYRNHAQELWQGMTSIIDTLVAEHDFDAALGLAEELDPSLTAVIDDFAARQAAIHTRANQMVDALIRDRRAIADDDVAELESLHERAMSVHYSSRHDDLDGLRHELTHSIARIHEERAQEIERRWRQSSGNLVEHLLNGRLTEARSLLERLSDDRQLGSLCPPVEDVINALAAYHGRAAAALRPRLNQNITIATQRGTQRGTLSQVDVGRGIAITISNRDPSTGVVAQATINLAWNLLCPQALAELAGEWPDGTAQQMAHAVVAIHAEDHQTARSMLSANRDHPLFHHLAGQLGDDQDDDHQDETEIARAFRDIQRRYRPRMSSDDARSLLQELEAWRQAHADSQFRRNLDNRDQELRMALHQIAHANLIPNGDFESNRLEGWESRGPAQASLSLIDSPQGRQHLRLYGSGRNGIEHRVITEVTVDQGGSYDFSALVRCANVSTEVSIEVHVDRRRVHQASFSGRSGGRATYRWRSGRRSTGGTRSDHWQSTSASFTIQAGQDVVVTIIGSSPDTMDLRVDDVVLRPQLR